MEKFGTYDVLLVSDGIKCRNDRRCWVMRFFFGLWFFFGLCDSLFCQSVLLCLADDEDLFPYMSHAHFGATNYWGFSALRSSAVLDDVCTPRATATCLWKVTVVIPGGLLLLTPIPISFLQNGAQLPSEAAWINQVYQCEIIKPIRGSMLVRPSRGRRYGECQTPRCKTKERKTREERKGVARGSMGCSITSEARCDFS